MLNRRIINHYKRNSLQLREENYNIMLAELLAERGLKALGEVILKKSGKRSEPDVLVVVNGIRIIVEGKKPGNWKQLIKNGQGRVDNNMCDLCVMVEYLDISTGKIAPTQLDVREGILKGKYNIGLLSIIERGLLKWIDVSPEPELYKNVTFDDLLTFIMTAYSRVVKEDIIAPVVTKINEVLQGFSNNVVSANLVNVDRLKQVLELRDKEGEENQE